MGFDFLKTIGSAVKGMMSPSQEQTKKTEPVPPKPKDGAAAGGGGWLMGALTQGMNFLGGKVADKMFPNGAPNIGSDDAEEPGTIGVTKGPGGEDSFIKTAAGPAKTETAPVVPPEAVKQSAEKAVAAPAEAAKEDKAKSEAAPVAAAKEEKAKADAAPVEAAKEDKAKALADPAAAAKADKAKAEADPTALAAADKAKAEASPADAAAAKTAKEAAAPADVAATEKAKTDAAPADALKEQKAKLDAPPTDAATPTKAKSDGPADKITPETASVAAKNPAVVAAAEKQPEALEVAKEKPEAGPVVAAVPAVAPVLKETPALAPIVAAAPELASAIAKDPGAPENKAIVEAAKDVKAPVVDKATPVTDETAKPAKMSPSEAFALAKAADVGDATAKAEAKTKIEADFDGFRKAQDAAREAPTQEGRDKQKEREEFERKLALSPEVRDAIKDPLDQMCNKALDYLTKTRGEDYLTKAGKGGMGDDLGTSAKTGFTGAVGQDPADMLAVMKSGNVRERALALQKFQEMMAADALRPAEKDADGKVIRPSGQDELKALFGTPKEGGEEDPNAFNAEDFTRLNTRVEAFQKSGVKDKTAKNFLNPKWTNDETFKAGKEEEMDRPLPAVSEGVARDQINKERAEEGKGQAPLAPGEQPKTGGLTGGGGRSAVAHKQMTIAEAQAQGLELSPREIKAAEANGGMVSWNQGTEANIVDPNSEFIQGATEGAMPLKAGISGNAYRFGRLGETMGMDPAMMRLAMVSQLVPIEAHSFHEISEASQDFQKDQKYDASQPYTQSSIGLPQAQLDKFLGREGYDLDKLNETPKPPEAT